MLRHRRRGCHWCCRWLLLLTSEEEGDLATPADQRTGDVDAHAPIASLHRVAYPTCGDCFRRGDSRDINDVAPLHPGIQWVWPALRGVVPCDGPHHRVDVEEEGHTRAESDVLRVEDELDTCPVDVVLRDADAIEAREDLGGGEDALGVEAGTQRLP